MLDWREFIKLCLKKKKMTNTEFMDRINRIKFYLGDRGIMRLNNISEYLNTNRGIEEKTLLIFEKALDLPMYTLVNMYLGTKSINVKRKNKEIEEKLKKWEN